MPHKPLYMGPHYASYIKIVRIDLHSDFLPLFFCNSFDQKMLRLDPSKRITARNALEHEYFKDIGFVP